jgi:hypothetical protein
MKKFEITSKGSLTQYVKENTIKAKGEISKSLFERGPADSCFGIILPETSKGLSVSL